MIPLPSRSAHGSVLVFALVVGAIITAVTTSFFNYFGSAVHAERVALASAQARALAEAGIDKAVYELNQNSSYSGESNTPLGMGTFSISVASIDGNTKRIIATGDVPGSSNPTAEKVIQAIVNIDSSIVSFRYGVQIGNGGVSMSNGSRIQGNIFANGDISGSGTITGDATVAVGVDPTPDQQSTTQNSGFNIGDTAAHSSVAQAFKPSVDASLAGISLHIKKNGSPGDLAVRITTDNSGKPSTTVIANGAIPASVVTTTYGLVNVALDSTPSIIANQTYWIVATLPTSASNYFVWGQDTSGGYSRGVAKYSTNWQGPTWNSITGDLDFMLYVVGIATSLSGVTVQGNAWASSLANCTVGGNASYQSISNCSVGGTKHPGTAPTAPVPLPISDSQIADWEAVAAGGGTITGPYSFSGTQTIGPKKINGDLSVTNGAKLVLSGPVWVNGNVTFSNNAFLSVSPNTGASGAVIIADATGNTATKGIVNLSNNVTINGNGTANSYPMIITTNTSGSAIGLSNNATSVILYAPYGTVEVENGASANQVTAKHLSLNNNSSITYRSGLQNVSFSNGPGGSWAIVPGTYVIVH